MLEHESSFVEGREVALSLFDKDYKHFYDTGAENVIPETTMRVFRNMRRLIWRSDWSGNMVLDQVTRRGGLGLLTSTENIGMRSGIFEEKNTRIAIANLIALGWIARVETTRTGSVYILGEVVTKDGKRLRKTSHGEGVLYQDAWADRLYADLYSHALATGRQNAREGEWLTSETKNGLTWAERMSFCAAWIRKNHPDAKLRAGCEKLLIRAVAEGGR